MEDKKYKISEFQRLREGHELSKKTAFFFLGFTHLSRVSVKHLPNLHGSTPTPQKRGSFPLELTDTNLIYFHRLSLSVCISAFNGREPVFCAGCLFNL